jgi:hypothetical protein
VEPEEEEEEDEEEEENKGSGDGREDWWRNSGFTKNIQNVVTEREKEKIGMRREK